VVDLGKSQARARRRLYAVLAASCVAPATATYAPGWYSPRHRGAAVLKRKAGAPRRCLYAGGD